MKKIMIALSLVAFLGSVTVATAVSTNEIVKTELTEKDKEKDKKKKKKGEKECTAAEKAACTKSEKTAKSSCSKSAAKSGCCSKKKATAEKK